MYCRSTVYPYPLVPTLLKSVRQGSEIVFNFDSALQITVQHGLIL